MNFFRFGDKLIRLAEKAEARAKTVFAEIESTAAYNSEKLHYAFVKNNVRETDFNPSSGYGYNDAGRDKLDKVFAQAFGAQDALVRHNLISGTHALTVTLFGVLRTGDTLVSLTGSPYDTLHKVIGNNGKNGKNGKNKGSLEDFGINYKEFDFGQFSQQQGGFSDQDMKNAVNGAKIALIQRSRGYSLREPLSCEQIGILAVAAKKANPDIIIFVDNCYGEFTERTEPCEHGADLIAGSLIKNPGGAIARTGGYIAGNTDLVEMCAHRLTTPGTGKDAGASLGMTREMFLGLYHAPAAVENALKSSAFALCLFEELGYEVYPSAQSARKDIVAVIKLGDKNKLIKFCEGIQAASPVDSSVTPIPWAMPGYDDEIIMAAGTFTSGSSIEISADAPLREPYAVFLQGGINYTAAKTAILTAAERIL
ncbi:MAG: methionine gamma-lyase family protein [Oscillospiraceae bacterium]|nr:methionine gamma-lyase family protein [Oscillospiraceae bacterium]